MARKPGTRASGEFVLFNVFYEDGTQRSNRKVPAELLGGLDGDSPARGVIEAQDREISAKSGMAPLAIKSIIAGGREGQRRREGVEARALAQLSGKLRPARFSPETPPRPARRHGRAACRAPPSPSRPRSKSPESSAR